MTGVFRALPALVLGVMLLSGCGEVVNIFITVDDDDFDYAANSDPWPEEIAEDIPVAFGELTTEESIDSDEDSNEGTGDTSDE